MKLTEGATPSNTQAFLCFHIIQAPKIIREFTPLLQSFFTFFITLRTIPRSYAPTALECNHQDSVVIKDCVPNLFQFLNSLGHTLPFLFFLPGWLHKPFLRPFFQAFLNLVLTLYLANFLSFLLSNGSLIALLLFQIPSLLLLAYLKCMSDYLHLKSAAKRVALKDLRWIPLSNYIYCVFFELVSKATDIYCCAYILLCLFL